VRFIYFCANVDETVFLPGMENNTDIIVKEDGKILIPCPVSDPDAKIVLYKKVNYIIPK